MRRHSFSISMDIIINVVKRNESSLNYKLYARYQNKIYLVHNNNWLEVHVIRYIAYTPQVRQLQWTIYFTSIYVYWHLKGLRIASSKHNFSCLNMSNRELYHTAVQMIMINNDRLFSYLDQFFTNSNADTLLWFENASARLVLGLSIHKWNF